MLSEELTFLPIQMLGVASEAKDMILLFLEAGVLMVPSTLMLSTISRLQEQLALIMWTPTCSLAEGRVPLIK